MQLSDRSSLEPVVITLEMQHQFKKKPGTKHVCLACGANRLHPDHGAFSWQSNGRLMDNRHVRDTTNDLWQEAMVVRLEATGLPRPCKFIEVFGRITFAAPPPARSKRDEDNYRYPLSKFLGDALQKGGWLRDDDWSSFRFRELDNEGVTPGQQRTSFMLVATV